MEKSEEEYEIRYPVGDPDPLTSRKARQLMSKGALLIL